MQTHHLGIAAALVVLLATGCGENAPQVLPTEPSAFGGGQTALRPGGSPSEIPLTPEEREALGTQTPPQSFTAELLARSAFPHPINAMFQHRWNGRTHVTHVRDASDVIANRLTLQEGASVGWHTHPGTAIGIVQAGRVGILEAHDCVARAYDAGEAFFHAGQGHPDIVFNAFAGPTVVYVFFLGVPAGQPAAIFGLPPGC